MSNSTQLSYQEAVSQLLSWIDSKTKAKHQMPAEIVLYVIEFIAATIHFAIELPDIHGIVGWFYPDGYTFGAVTNGGVTLIRHKYNPTGEEKALTIEQTVRHTNRQDAVGKFQSERILVEPPNLILAPNGSDADAIEYVQFSNPGTRTFYVPNHGPEVTHLGVVNFNGEPHILCFNGHIYYLQAPSGPNGISTSYFLPANDRFNGATNTVGNNFLLVTGQIPEVHIAEDQQQNVAMVLPTTDDLGKFFPVFVVTYCCAYDDEGISDGKYLYLVRPGCFICGNKPSLAQYKLPEGPFLEGPRVDVEEVISQTIDLPQHEGFRPFTLGLTSSGLLVVFLANAVEEKDKESLIVLIRFPNGEFLPYFLDQSTSDFNVSTGTDKLRHELLLYYPNKVVVIRAFELPDYKVGFKSSTLTVNGAIIDSAQFIPESTNVFVCFHADTKEYDNTDHIANMAMCYGMVASPFTSHCAMVSRINPRKRKTPDM